MIIDLVKVVLPLVLSFGVGIVFTPWLTDYLYKNKMWKKKSGKKDFAGNDTKLFNQIHEKKEVGTPRLGGVVIWFSAVFTILFIWFVSMIYPADVFIKLDFLSRDQTWIPLATLILGALFGLFDDLLEIKGNGGHIAGGLSLKKRLLVIFLIGIAVGSWFFLKLDISSIGLPNGLVELPLGLLFIPFVALVMMAVYSGGVIDGIDGLAGGIFATMFAAYGGIAFFQGQINLAAFCAAIAGATLAFLWFNIPPARFYMSETGSMALTVTLTVVAFMTDRLGEGYGILILPIIAFPLVITTLSVIIQVLSKKFRNGKKVFKIAPIHHHFEAIGWPSYKVTMRYWIVGAVFSISGMVLALIG